MIQIFIQMKTKYLTLFLALCALCVQAQTLTDTYWRNTKTGEWIIGFAENHVIYDCRTWDILTRAEKKDKYEFTIAQSNDTLAVSVSKLKKGVRKVRIGKAKAIACEAITTKTLPDYPTPDARTTFKDNGYRAGDSVTIYGWVKNLTPELLNEGGGKFVDIDIENFITDEEESFNAPLDSLGRYHITVPVLNATETYIDWGRSMFNTVLEPGETYFFLYDAKTGQQLVMGKDARLQNELLAYPENFGGNDIYAYYYRVRKSKVDLRSLPDEEMLKYLDFVKQEKATADSLLDLRLKEHPNLSQRYAQYLRNLYKAQVGRNLMQAKFLAKSDTLPPEFMDYVTQECWNKMGTPYTLYRNLSTMTQNYLEYMERETSGSDAIEKVLNLERKGIVKLTDKELNYFKEYKGKFAELQKKADGRPLEEIEAMVSEFNNTEMAKTISEVLKRFQSELIVDLVPDETQTVIDSIQLEPVLQEIYIARKLYGLIEDRVQPLPKSTIQWMNENIKMDFARQAVLALHEKYDALMRKDFSNTTSLLSTDNLEGITEGEQILRELIAPWKGKVILIDVWGTWCGPCKAALKHSQELYERMKPYNMFFLYLANHSDDTSWKNVIKEYNVNGENVGHVNLPQEQQAAVERFLNVNQYPSYFLIDREGHLLQVNADPRYLDQFEELVKGMAD